MKTVRFKLSYVQQSSGREVESARFRSYSVSHRYNDKRKPTAMRAKIEPEYQGYLQGPQLLSEVNLTSLDKIVSVNGINTNYFTPQ